MAQILVTIRHKQFADDFELPANLDLEQLRQVLSCSLNWNLPDFWTFFDAESERPISGSFEAFGLLDGCIVDIRETARNRSKDSPVLGWQKMNHTPVAEDATGGPPVNDGFAWKEK
jgi:hypothetical protein